MLHQRRKDEVDIFNRSTMRCSKVIKSRTRDGCTKLDYCNKPIYKLIHIGIQMRRKKFVPHKKFEIVLDKIYCCKKHYIEFMKSHYYAH